MTSCASRSERTGEPFVPFDGWRTTTSTSTASSATTACARSSPHVESRCPRVTRATRPSAETVAGLGNRKNELVLALIHAAASRPTMARCATSSGTRHRAAPGAWSRRAPIAGRCLVAAGIEDLFEVRIDGLVAAREHLKGKPAPDTFLAAAQSARGAAVAGSGVRGRARRRRGAGERGGSASSSASTGPGRRRRCASTAPTRRLRPRRAARRVITHPAFTVEPWSVRETHLDLDVLAPERVGVRARQRAHRAAREPRRRRAVRPAGHYLNSFYELRPLPYAEAGYGYPESGQTIVNVTNGKIIRLLVDDEPFDVRYGRLLAHERVARPARGRPAPRVPSGGRRPALPCGFARRGSSRSSSARLRRSCTRSSRSAARSASSSSRSSSPTSRGRQLRPIHARPPRWKRRSSRRASSTATRASCWCTPPGAAISAWRRAWTTSSRGRTAPSRRSESGPDVGRVTVATELAEGARLRVVKFLAYGWSSQRSLPAVRDQVVAALTAARHTGWDGLLDGQRAYLDEFWDSRRRRARGRHSSCSRRFASRSSTRCRPARAPSSARSPPRA